MRDRPWGQPEVETIGQHVRWRLGSPQATMLHIVVFVLAGSGVAAFVNHASPQLKLVSGSFHPSALGQEHLAEALATGLAYLLPPEKLRE
jgi:hypothetical protein